MAIGKQQRVRLPVAPSGATATGPSSAPGAPESALGEFSDAALTRPDLNRRELFRLLGASAALSALGGCGQRRREKILPYVRQPPGVTAGVPLQYATSAVLDGFAIGLVVESREGRPVKIEGNPDHPASLGATSAWDQASILDLYDPARLKAPLRDGVPANWELALRDVRGVGARGRPPWFVMPPQSSPLIEMLIERVRKRLPGARFVFHSPTPHTRVYAATRAAFGRPLEPQFDFTKARVVLALDADFTSTMPMSVRWARDFAEGRRLERPKDPMNRLYAVEAMFTPTGSVADHRLAVRALDVPGVALRILGELAASGRGAPGLPAEIARRLPRAEGSPHAAFIRAVARDLLAAPGASIVIAGDRQPVSTHLAAHAMNAALGNHGKTTSFTEPVLLAPEGEASLEDLVTAIRSKAVDTVVLLDTNPVYDADAELELAAHLRSVPNTFHLTQLENETSSACHWVLPGTHYLESWGDARAYDGTLSVIQPLIEPLYPGRSIPEVLALFAGEIDARGHELLREHFRTRTQGKGPQWEALLQRGLDPESAFERVEAKPSFAGAAEPLRAALEPPAPGLELNFEKSPAVYDGRFANNPWLQELPHPLTKQCWGNAAILSAATASALGVETGQVLHVRAGKRALDVPALILPGHADHSITLELGYGRTQGGPIAEGLGANAYRLRPRDAAAVGNIAVEVTPKRERVAVTQEQRHLYRRPLALVGTLGEYRKNPEAITGELHGETPSLLPPRVFRGPQWAMTIDTTVCTGCGACVVACQAENNVPVVGKEGVLRAREMHWLRIDTYFFGQDERPRVVHQPMLCQHCEMAPCEYVCPVNATVHSPDGLNEMVYNRCIGTRFCSNNCPYKVRRFNYFEYTRDETTTRMQRNPEVTVRERGVMEKCTYCVQRIRTAEIRSRVERTPIRPGEVVTACQQACATGAIQFGSLEHEDTPMVAWRKQPRSYAVLHDQGTRPRTLYLAKIVNEKEELAT
ncbi:MAG TPA: 4Fe-4S dicluster domain-containing protein [Polyangiaceae bacterium]|nr:4Fe-4S dicluster domain-containing protein [Polyangiaceae bacterium]